VETVEEPVVIEGQGGEKGITHTTTTTETTTVKKGSITETQQVEYVDSRVGLTLQMLDKTTGEVIWSNSYWYNALSLSNAVDKCVAGAVKPLAQLLK
jgi:TolB-like protein